MTLMAQALNRRSFVAYGPFDVSQARALAILDGYRDGAQVRWINVPDQGNPQIDPHAWWRAQLYGATASVGFAGPLADPGSQDPAPSHPDGVSDTVVAGLAS
jgi:hypothetical protein